MEPKENKVMEKKIEAAMHFYLSATKLKYKIRSGWDKNHWNIKSDRIESIAEHVYGTSILAIALNSEFDLDLDMEKVLKMLAVPFYTISEISSNFGYDGIQEQMNSQLSARELQYVTNESVGGITALATDSASNSKSTTSTSKDYSTTNIQVENVDEADINKTDGHYIYSISDNKDLLGYPKDYTLHVKDIRIQTGSKMIIVLLNDIITMPGLPKVPNYESMQ